MYIYYLLVIILLYIVIQLMPVYIEVYAMNNDDKKYFKISIITFFSLLKINLDVSRLKKIFNRVKKLRKKILGKKVKKVKIMTYLSKNLIFDLIKSIKLHKLNLKLFLGLNEASKTAIVMGILYSFIGIIKPITSNIPASNDYEENVDIKPFYNQFRFDLEFNFKIKFRLINFSLIVLKQILALIRRRIKKWTIIPSRA